MPPKNKGMPPSTAPDRQETSESTHTTSSGVNAPPQRALSHITPIARDRSGKGSQEVKSFARLGKHPASPAPKSARITRSDGNPRTHPVAAVKKDHHTT